MIGLNHPVNHCRTHLSFISTNYNCRYNKRYNCRYSYSIMNVQLIVYHKLFSFNLSTFFKCKIFLPLLEIKIRNIFVNQTHRRLKYNAKILTMTSFVGLTPSSMMPSRLTWKFPKILSDIYYVHSINGCTPLNL